MNVFVCAWAREVSTKCSYRCLKQTSAEWVDREDIRRLVATAVRVGFVLDGVTLV